MSARDEELKSPVGQFGPTATSSEQFRKALGDHSGQIEVPEVLGDVLSEAAASDGVASSAPSSVLADAWNQFGDVLFNRCSTGFLEALHAYRMSIASDPTRFAAFRGVGECLARRKCLDEARLAHDIWFGHWIASEAGADLRQQQAARMGPSRPPILLIAMQKSASEYIRDTLLRALDIPLIYATVGTVPRDRFVPSALRQLALGGALCRTHADAGDVSAIIGAGIDRIVVHVRDPRQVTISWTHMMRRLAPVEFNYSAPMYDPPVPERFPEWPFEQQLAWSFSQYFPEQVNWLDGWVSAIEAGCSLNILLTSYDEFHRDQQRYFQRLLDHLEISDRRSSELRPQTPADTRNFRAGDPAEWKQILSPEMRRGLWPHMARFERRFGWTC